MVGAWRKASLEKENEAEPSSLGTDIGINNENVISFVSTKILSLFCCHFSWWRYKYFAGDPPTVKIYYYALISITRGCIHYTGLYTVYTMYTVHTMLLSAGIHSPGDQDKNRNKKTISQLTFINTVRQFFSLPK